MTYHLVRFYRHATRYRGRLVYNRVLPGTRGMTLAEAQAHCSNPATRCAGIWFDGYDAD